MLWLVVKTYGNGKHMNKVYPGYCEYLSQATSLADQLNKTDADIAEKWVAMPIDEYLGPIHVPEEK